jgi:hypothetical protein
VRCLLENGARERKKIMEWDFGLGFYENQRRVWGFGLGFHEEEGKKNGFGGFYFYY